MEFWGNLLGIVASTTTVIGMLPQVYKAYRTKSTNDVSLVMLANYFLCSGAWFLYAFYLEDDLYIMLSNAFNIIVAIVSIWQKVVYDARKPE